MTLQDCSTKHLKMMLKANRELIRWYGKEYKNPYKAMRICPYCMMMKLLGLDCSTACPWYLIDKIDCTHYLRLKFGTNCTMSDLRMSPTPEWAEDSLKRLKRWEGDIKGEIGRRK